MRKLRKALVVGAAALAAANVFSEVGNLIPNWSFEIGTVIADNSGNYGVIGDRNYTADWTFGGEAWLSKNNTPVCPNMGIPDGSYVLALKDGAAATNAFTVATSGVYQFQYSRIAKTTAGSELKIFFDGQEFVTVTNSVEAWTMEVLPVHLTAGAHELQFSATAIGSGGISVVDDFVLGLEIAGDAVASDRVVSGGVPAMINGHEIVRAFMDSGQANTVTVNEPVYVDLLAVGGGGSGGSGYRAGGGGAGEVLHKQNVLLEAGMYEISIGAGGVSTGSMNTGSTGGNGGNTTITRIDGATRTVIYESVGGGGGGGGNDGYPAVGASGGGGCGNQSAYGWRGAFGISGKGYGGGDSSSNLNGGGGGGAGAPGDDIGEGGTGGKGVYCDISGASDYYGWGGAGLGAVGDPQGFGSYSYSKTPGRPNHGGGGGGSTVNARATSGGCGMVILRYGARPAVVAGSPVLYTAAQPRIGSQSLRLTGRLADLGGAASASVKILYGKSATVMTSEKAVGVYSAAGDFTVDIDGLDRYTDYYYCFEATGTATALSDVRKAKTLGFPQVSVSGGVTVTTNGVYELSAYSSDGTFTLEEPGIVDVLLVGGGGGSQGSDTSSHAGGGGGGGGVVYNEDVTLTPGLAYQVVIGAGGAASTTGGTSHLAMTNDSGTVTQYVYRAFGGGGGGGKRGATGGGAGGNAVSTTVVYHNKWMQGFNGAGEWTTAPYGGGGGGGAGDDGLPDTAAYGGSGGAGTVCAITGGNVRYGGGGGGGGMSSMGVAGGFGGLGGGGDGFSSSSGAPGTDGLGGGAGGSGGIGKSGAVGGSGVVIIRRRILDADDTTPYATAAAPNVGATFAKFPVELFFTGNGYSTADVYVSCVPNGSGSAFSKVNEGLPEGTLWTYVKTGLSAETEYDYAIIVSNAVAGIEVDSGSFTTAAEGEATENPVFGGFSCTVVDDYSASVTGSVANAGQGSSVVMLTVTWGSDSANPAYTNVYSDVIGEFDYPIDRIQPGTSCYVKVTLSNGAGKTAVETAEVSVPDETIEIGLQTAGFTQADLAYKLKAYGTDAVSAALTFEYATDAAFSAASQVTLASESGTLPAVRTIGLEGLAKNTTYYGRIQSVNDLGVVALSQVFAFTTLADAGAISPVSAYRTLAGTTEASAYVSWLAPEATAKMELYVDEILTETWNDVAAASACVYELPDAASHTLRYVATVTVGADEKTYEAMKTVSPVSAGGSYYAPGSPGSVADLSNVVYYVGDVILIPGNDTDSTFTCDDNASIAVSGRTITCAEPGATYLRTYTRKQDPFTGADVDTLAASVPVIIAPKAEDYPGGVWVRCTLGTGSSNESGNWTDTTRWTCLSGDASKGYPDGADVCALFYYPARVSGTQTLTMPGGGVTLGHLGIGEIAAGKTLVVSGGTINYRTTRIDSSTKRPVHAWYRLYNRGTRTSSAMSYSSCTNVFLVDTDIDFMDTVGQNITWSVMSIPDGVTVRTIRGRYESNYTGGFTFSGDLLGTGTLRFDADCYNWFGGTWLRSFGGTIDLANGKAGSDHGATGINMRGAGFPDAKGIIVRGVYGSSGGCFWTGQGSAGAPVSIVTNMFPKTVTLDGGQLQFGAPGSGTATDMYLYGIDDLNLQGPMGRFRVCNIIRYGTMYASTTAVSRLNVAVGTTERFNRGTPAVIRSLTTPDYAVQDDEDENTEFLPYLIPEDYNGNLLSAYRAFRDKTTGEILTCTNGVYFTSDNTVWPTNSHLYSYRNLNGAQYKTVNDGWTMKSVSFLTGSSGIQFAASNSTFNVSGGMLWHHGHNSSNLPRLAPPDNSYSASSCIASPGPLYIYQSATEDVLVGCKFKTTKGFVKSLTGRLVLCADTSDTLSGGIHVNCGTLQLGNDTYAAYTGDNPITVSAGATLSVVSDQPFANTTVLNLEDRAGAACGVCAKVALAPAGTACGKLCVDGVIRPRGTYGASGSGADNIDDDHFSGTGILVVRRDDKKYGLYMAVW